MLNIADMTDEELDQLPLSDSILVLVEMTVLFLEGLPGRRRVFTPQLRREIAAHAHGLRSVLVRLQAVDAQVKADVAQQSACEHDWLLGECTKCHAPEP